MLVKKLRVGLSNDAYTADPLASRFDCASGFHVSVLFELAAELRDQRNQVGFCGEEY